MPRLEHPNIQVSIEYSDQKDQTVVTVRYNGEPFDPAETDNKLSYTLIKHSAGSIRHEVVTGGDYTNQVVMVMAI